MKVSPGTVLYGLDGKSYRLSQKIGEGGEGSVWDLDSDNKIVAKVYHTAPSDATLAKLGAMCRIKTDALSSVAAWPITLLKAARAEKPNGILMRRIIGYHSVHQLYGLKSRLRVFPDAQFPFLIHSAINTAKAFATVHGAGQVIGDVNHSNLMISQGATAALIDCDSFQISDGGRTYYCEVGVPDFTPPELQGVQFSGQRRTSQHDAFGLSVLIFQLLFLGRHPFMGLCDPSRDDIVAIDSAISLYKFPYLIDPKSPEVKLPPYAPQLADFPSQIGNFFSRAFTRDALTKGRPSAAEWITALTSLLGTLQPCTRNPNHQFSKAAKDCPWCRIEGVVGKPIFGIKVNVVTDRNFNLVAVWAEIEAVRPNPEPLGKPNPSQLKAKMSVDSRIHEIVRRRRNYRFAAVAILGLSSLPAVAVLPGVVAFVVILMALIVAATLWGKGAKPAWEFADAYRKALSDFKAAENAFELSAQVPETFTAEKSKLDGVRRELQELPGVKARKLATLQSEREKKQRQHFLESFRIEDAVLPGIGPKNKLALRAWGIEDAWDVELRKISSIKGFGPKKQNVLTQWRGGIEAKFRFNPSQGVDPRDLLDLDRSIAQRTQILQGTLRAGPNALRQVIGVWSAQRRQMATRLEFLAGQLAQAQVNRDALRRL